MTVEKLKEIRDTMIGFIEEENLTIKQTEELMYYLSSFCNTYKDIRQDEILNTSAITAIKETKDEMMSAYYERRLEQAAESISSPWKSWRAVGKEKQKESRIAKSHD